MENKGFYIISCKESSPVRDALCAVVLTFVFFSNHAAADDSPGSFFKRANDAYLEGRYEVAAGLYERIVLHQKVFHEDVFYNLGNAYFRIGELGRAVYNYERALKIAPGHESARFNLETAREAAKRKAGDEVVGAVGEPFWVRMVCALTPKSIVIWFLLFWYLCFGFLISLFFLKKGVKRVLAASGGSLLGIAALMFGLMLAGRSHYERNRPQGIVLQNVVEVREGPRSNAVSAFKIHQGLKVRLLESDMDWYKIQLANGLEGWVERRTIGKL